MDNSNKQKKYFYLYKTTNIINNKIYYGIHRTNNINDGYIGSGTALKHAINKYGKEFFEKEIIEFFDTEEDLLACERRLVNANFIKDKNNYNLTIGGNCPLSVSVENFWESEDGLIYRKKLSEIFKGYTNPAFIKQYKPLYDSIKEEFSILTARTNLPNKFIQRTLKPKVSFKFYRLLEYCIHCGYIDIIESNTKFKDYFTHNGTINTLIKTNVSSGKYKNIPFKIYKRLNQEYLSLFPEIRKVIEDYTISDSMLYNGKLIEFPKSRIIERTILKYYIYLGIIEKTGEVRINIRKRRPLSQRSTGLKTIFRIKENIEQKYILIEDNIDEQYKISYNGKTFQATRI